LKKSVSENIMPTPAGIMLFKDLALYFFERLTLHTGKIMLVNMPS
jgi:hypothetical protein